MFTKEEQAAIDEYEKAAAESRARSDSLAGQWHHANDEDKEAFVSDPQLQDMGIDLVILDSRLPEAYRKLLDE